MNGTSRRTATTRWATAALLAAVAGAIPVASAGEGAPTEIWLISTRAAPRSGRLTAAEEKIRCWQWDADHWRAAPAQQLWADRRSLPTTIFIHGNRVDSSRAISIGWQVYRRVERLAAGRSFRFVIWSWPSEQFQRRTREDIRLKACYSDTQAYYLAGSLQACPAQVCVNLVGYSFGARVITGALHLLGGGQVAGRRLPSHPPAEARPRIRAMLVAAALDADWLRPGHRHGLALSQVEQMLVTCNACDPVLKWYPLMYCRGGPSALGHSGPVGCPDPKKFKLLDLTCSVGRNHGLASYLGAASLRRRLGQYAFTP